MSNSRLVYSTDGGRTCVKCGWPLSNCQCSKTIGVGKASIPDRVTAKMRMEKKGRGGKTVTVIFGLPANDEFLRSLCSELKKACGCGGSATEDGVELQGDLRDRVRTHLTNKGFVVRG